MQSPVLEFDKNCTQNAYFLQKIEFCIFEPKNREVIENSSKTPLNFSSLQYTYLDKKSFQFHKGLVRKKEIEKWLLRTSVQCRANVKKNVIYQAIIHSIESARKTRASKRLLLLQNNVIHGVTRCNVVFTLERRNSYANMRHNPTIGWISLVQWRKVGRSRRLQMYFSHLLCVKIEIDQLYCVNC